MYDKRKIEDSLNRVQRWIEDHDYRGFEPFDGLTSYLYPLTLGNKFLRQVLQQTIRRSPINLRPFLGVKPLDSTKGRGFIAWGHLKRAQITGAAEHKEKAMNCLDWLATNKSPLYKQHSWGNHFNYVSRGGYIWKGESTIVWTGLIGQVFLEAFFLWGEPRHREVIGSIRDWILSLPREKTVTGTCLSYVYKKKSSIHNSNMIGSAFLAGAGNLLGDSEALSVAHDAMEYSCSRQLSNGAWYYGDAPKFHWIDVFHTGYNLDSLRRYGEYSADESFSSHLKKGYVYFFDKFFEQSGRVKYYGHKAKPIDIQCAAQAIDTLALFSPDYPESIAKAYAAANWTIDHMQDPGGHFYFRTYSNGRSNKTPMIHWGQATMYKALAHLLSIL